jgi:PBP1b-binding outer membrane lipoprotein LpoB
MKRISLLLFLLILTLGCSQETPALEPAAQCYFDAVNTQDLEALTACFAADATIIDVSREIAGVDAIRTWAENEVIGGTLELIEVAETTEQSVRLLVQWAPAGSDGWQAYYTFEWNEEGQLIRADLQYA